MACLHKLDWTSEALKFTRASIKIQWRGHPAKMCQSLPFIAGCQHLFYLFEAFLSYLEHKSKQNSLKDIKQIKI